MYIFIHEPGQTTLISDEEQLPQNSSIFNDFQNIKLIISSDTKASFNEYSNNKIIIQAAGGLVINRNDELLMIFRRGSWDLPKGKLDPGETIEECAIREVQEETGLINVNVKKKLQTTYHTYFMNEKTALKPSHWFLVEFKGDELPVPQTEEDITDIQWLNKPQVNALKDKMYPSIREMVSKYFL